MHRLLDLTTNRGQRRSLVRRLTFFWKQSEDQSRIFGCSNVTYVTERKWKMHPFQIQRQPSKLHEAIDSSGWSTLCVLTCVPQRQQAYCLKASDKCSFFSLDILILSVYDTFRRKIDISFRYFVLQLMKDGCVNFSFFEFFLQQNMATIVRNLFLNLMLGSITIGPSDWLCSLETRGQCLGLQTSVQADVSFIEWPNGRSKEVHTE